MWSYRGRVLRWVDGDTVDVWLDLGFDVSVRQRLRLFGLNAPEIRTRDSLEKARGEKAWARCLDLAPSGAAVFVVTDHDKRGSFGRYLATLYVGRDASGVSVNRTLLTEGLAVPFDQ